MGRTGRRSFNSTRHTGGKQPEWMSDPRRGVPGSGQFAPTRVAWLEATSPIGAVVHKDMLSARRIFEDVPVVTLEVGYTNNKISMDLTQLRADELLALKKVFDAAVELALPLCEEIDKKAKEEMESGYGTYARNYRAVPQFNRVEWWQPEHIARVQKRLDAVSALDAEERPGDTAAADPGDA